jgi:asparagine synthase (glutamine-hydrolysing)
MCGISGLIGSGNQTESVEAMVKSMHHRGPDDSGVQTIQVGDRQVVLGNTRLSIIDLSAAGHMPMANPDTGNWIAYNGEVYNFKDVRRELEGRGITFRSHTDTEVILKSYEVWGAACVQKLRGMFAFAIWDAEKRELFVARDRIGKKPLYWHQTKNGEFLFASEVRTLLASGKIDRKLDRVGVETYLFNGFVISPRTILQNVQQLLPAHWMRVNLDGKIVETQRYWWLPEPAPEASWTPEREAEVIEEVRAAMDESVKLRLVSDVPIGAFLSGGLDSSAVVAIMAKHSDARTFAVTFNEDKFDESPFSNWVAKKFNTNHTEVRLTRHDFMRWLPDALASQDQPSFDGPNSYCVSRATKEKGVTVALSGLGGDELFGGYGYFDRTSDRLALFHRVTSAFPTAIRSLITRSQEAAPFRTAGPWAVLEMFSYAQNGLDNNRASAFASYQTRAMTFPIWTRRKLQSTPLTEPLAYGLPCEFVDFVDERNNDNVMLGEISRLATFLFLGERTLRDIDTMSMGVSLEVRAPFTDHKFIESVWKIPSRVRCAGVPYKPMMWKIAKAFLTEEYPYRKKQGFVFPFEQWVRENDFFGLMKSTLLDATLAQSIGFDPHSIRAFTREFERGVLPIRWPSLWSLFSLFSWCQRNRVIA